MPFLIVLAIGLALIGPPTIGGDPVAAVLTPVFSWSAAA